MSIAHESEITQATIGERAMRRRTVPMDPIEILSTPMDAHPASIPYFSVPDFVAGQPLENIDATLHDGKTPQDVDKDFQEGVATDEQISEMFAPDAAIFSKYEGITGLLIDLHNRTETTENEANENADKAIAAAEHAYEQKIQNVEAAVHAAIRALIYDANIVIANAHEDKDQIIRATEETRARDTLISKTDKDVLQVLTDKNETAKSFQDEHVKRLDAIIKAANHVTIAVNRLKAQEEQDKANLKTAHDNQFNALKTQRDLIEQETALQRRAETAVGAEAVTIASLLEIHPKKLLVNKDEVDDCNDAVAKAQTALTRTQEQIEEKTERLTVIKTNYFTETGDPVQSLAEYSNRLDERATLLAQIIDGSFTADPKFVPPSELRPSIQVRQKTKVILHAVSNEDRPEPMFLNAPVPHILQPDETDKSTIGENAAMHEAIAETHVVIDEMKLGSRLDLKFLNTYDLVKNGILNRGRNISFGRKTADTTEKLATDNVTEEE